MPKEVLKITKDYMFSPKRIEQLVEMKEAKNVEHHYYMVNAKDRYKAFRRLCDINLIFMELYFVELEEKQRKLQIN